MLRGSSVFGHAVRAGTRTCIAQASARARSEPRSIPFQSWLQKRYRRQAAYSLGPHSVRPLRRLAGGCAPSDPCVSGPPRGRRTARCSIPRTSSREPRPSAAPAVADDQADVIPRLPASRELGRDRRGLEDPPVGESWADWVAAIRVMLPPNTLSSPETALTAILGVWGAVWRNPRP